MYVRSECDTTCEVRYLRGQVVIVLVGQLLLHPLAEPGHRPDEELLQLLRRKHAHKSLYANHIHLIILKLCNFIYSMYVCIYV